MGLPPFERRRVREVHKYCTRFQDGPYSEEEIQTNLSTVATTKIASPNTNLTALMQLIAWRLGMQRAMVSVVDENEQYFLAESTKTLNLEDTSQADQKDDELWMGCGSTLRSEALCANTIEVPRTPDAYACFSVGDLSQDPRFCNLPYVAGGPRFRYYAGTPLLTNQGVPIGSVFVIDDRVRGLPSKAEIDFLGVMAKNVMEYLEMKRGSELLQRNDIMSRGLAALVEGESTIPPQRGEGVNQNAQGPASNISTETPKIIRGPANKTFTTILENLKMEDSSGGEEIPSRIRLPLRAEDADVTHDRIFARAINLLRESLDSDYTVFFDTNAAMSAPSDITSRQNGSAQLDIVNAVNSLAQPKLSTSPEETALPPQSPEGNPPDNVSRTDVIHTSAYKTSKPLAQVLSFSTVTASSLNGDSASSYHGFRSPDIKRLSRLLRRYPSGKLWSFTVDGEESSSEDYAETATTHSPAPSITQDPVSRQREAELLLDCFPKARQVLLAPLWEAGTSNEFGACFVVSLRESPMFLSEREPAFLRAFLNNVSIECSRVTMAAANRQKGDFISSISHELRSPLHGIIASAELLAESRLDGRQREFCDTIETCGRVLLKTILDVLDYTKINNVSRESRKVKKSTQRRTDRLQSICQEEELPSVLATEEFASSITDLAKLCEDSVNVVAAAHQHHTTRTDLALHRVQSSSNGASHQNGHTTHIEDGVSMVLNILPGNWNFVCLPGAIQRIIMNVAGNSLKYTPAGTIQVDLFLESKESVTQDGKTHESEQTTVVLRVCDTGNGISADFLKNKLFTPFSQESTLAPGTGLGLNMVKSLVDLQHGTIDLQSEVGKGTTVVVRIPLPKAQRKSIPPPLLRVTSYGKDTQPLESKRLKRENFEFQGFRSVASKVLKDSVSRYLVDWFEMSKASGEEPAKIVIVHEEDLDDCLFTIEQYTTTPQLIIICHQTSQEQLFQRLSRSTIAGELLTMPFGPQKLAKVLSICLSALDKFQAMAGANIMKEKEPPKVEMVPVADTTSVLESTLPVDAADPQEVTLHASADQVPNEIVSADAIIPDSLPTATVIDNLTKSAEVLPPYSGVASTEVAPDSVKDDAKVEEQPKRSKTVDVQPQLPEVPTRNTANIDDTIQVTIPEVLIAKNEELPLRAKPQIPPPITIFKNNISSPIERMTKAVDSVQKASTLRILCVDDNPINLRLLKTYMEKLRYTDVTCAENGALAFDAVKRRLENFDLIFMDLSMPVTDGFEAISLIRVLENMETKVTRRNVTPPTPAVIVALTGLAAQRDRDAAMAAGADHYVTKPLKFSALRELLVEWGVRADGMTG